MNAALHLRPVNTVRRSFLAFRVKAGAAVEKETQGEVRTKPRRGADRFRGGMGCVFEGCGCMMWESRARAKFAPAESPVRIMFWGSLCSLLRTWSRRAAACWSWRGYLAIGARSGGVRGLFNTMREEDRP